MYKLKKSFRISSSHRLHSPQLSEVENKATYGRCNNEPSHGHNYKIILTLEAEHINEATGMIMNFNDIKAAFKEHIDNVYDHQCLNNCPGFEKIPATAENMAKVFYDILIKLLHNLKSVEVEETEGASAIYEGE